MRVSLAVLLSTIVGVLAAAPALAGTLDSRESEWTFDLNYTNQSSVGSTTSFRFAYGYLIGKGYSELGIESTYARLDDKTSGGGTFNSSVYGLFYAWNWTPMSARATGFLSIGAGSVGGNANRGFDYALDGAIGVKLFVGDSAAVTARYIYQRFERLNGSSFSANSEDFTGVAIGLSLYTNRK
jgi:hypothetical protein